MTPEDLERVKAAHAEALRAAPGNREHLVRKSFPDEPQLEAEVLRLLRWHDEAGEFLNVPVTSGAELHAPDLTGRRVENYELVRELGRGGSACVYLARKADDLFERHVAIKLLNRLSHSEGAFRHFQREAQVLARAKHPYIVSMFDAGTTGEALAYIVTEYVEGKRIDDYCREVPLREKVQLFVKVCEGVSAAHRNLIVHRDIKTSNVMVTADGTPKLLDFGIAILLDQRERLTVTGLQSMTVQYASPEQIRGDKDVSTLTDVYSLGALLYELIAGHAPYPFPLHELPSRILTEEPAPIRAVSHDLEAIVFKALQKEPSNRYESVERFRDDLSRFLEGRPVLARGTSTRYRLLKFSRKYWLPLTSGILIVGLLSVLAVVSILGARNARRQSDRVKELLITAFERAQNDPRATRIFGLRATLTLEEARLRYLELFHEEYRNDLGFQAQRYGSWCAIGSVQGLPSGLNLGETASARASFENAVQVGEQIVKGWPTAATYRDLVALTHLNLGAVLIEMNRQEEARVHFARAEDLARRTSSSLDMRVALEALAQRSRILVRQGQPGEALRLRAEVVQGRRKLFEKDPDSLRWEYPGALCSYGELLGELHRLPEAERAYATALPLLEPFLKRPLALAEIWHVARENEEYAKILLAVGNDPLASDHLDRALALYRDIMRQEPDSKSNQRALAVGLTLRGKVLLKHGERVRGRQFIMEALALIEAAAQHDPASIRLQGELSSIRDTFAALSR